jgi:hypothetical protein
MTSVSDGNAGNSASQEAPKGAEPNQPLQSGGGLLGNDLMACEVGFGRFRNRWRAECRQSGRMPVDGVLTGVGGWSLEREPSPAYNAPRPRDGFGGRPRTEHDPRTMAKLAALRRGGASIRRIANELGLSATTVTRLVSDQAARPSRPQLRRLHEEKDGAHPVPAEH